MKTKRVIAVITIVAALFMATLISGCSSWSRDLKSFESDMSGGMPRVVTVYDNTGEKIASWEGNIDVQYQDGHTLFDLNGKRTTITGGIVIVQEQ